MQFRRVPRVLYISDWSTGDYGTQRIFDGFCDLLGWRSVIEWPHNPYHHRLSCATLDYDSELRYPRQFWDEYEIRDLLTMHLVDLVVISSARALALGTARQLGDWLINASAGTILLDMEDSAEISDESFRQAGIKLLAVFKRERPKQDTDGNWPLFPLPFSYPRSRVTVTPKPDDGPLVFYHAHDWGWAADTSPRVAMVTALADRFGELADVGLSREVGPPGPPPGYLDNAEYHRRLAAAKIGISLNRDGGSDTNRYWETVANGCVLVSDRTRHEIPDDFIDGEEAFFYESTEEAVAICERLQADDGLRQRVALAGMRKFLTFHTTAARAAYILETVVGLHQQAQRYLDWVA